jgi:hypothetical protein
MRGSRGVHPYDATAARISHEKKRNEPQMHTDAHRSEEKNGVFLF